MPGWRDYAGGSGGHLLAPAVRSARSRCSPVSPLPGPALPSPGHAYCYYFSGTGRSGGMHLVAASPTTLAAGPSNYVSGLGGDPQDTVFYIDCVPGQGRIGGDAYVGIPRIAMHLANGHYTFATQFVDHGIRHLETRSSVKTTATVSLSGTVSAGVINGTVHISAPGCLPHALSIVYAGR